MRALYLLLLTGALLLTQGCSARTVYRGEVVGISDGDTVRVLDEARRVHKVRLAWIDAPEENMPYGQVARQNLAKRVFRQQVTVEVFTEDRYGREVAVLRLGEVDINHMQVSDGLAWHYVHYARKDQDKDDFDRYAAAEEGARAFRLGLWMDPQPQPPWQWRASRRANHGE